MPIGVYQRTEEHKKILRELRLKSMGCLCECGCGGVVKRKRNRFINGHNSRGENNPMFGIHRYGEEAPTFGKKSWAAGLTKETDERIGKMAETIRQRWPVIFADREDIKGQNNPNWLGGVSNAPYSFEFNDELKERIRERDNHTCQLCGTPQAECSMALDVHHIGYDKENIADENLISLCKSCNARVNYNRDYWTEYFTRTFEGTRNQVKPSQTLVLAERP